MVLTTAMALLSEASPGRRYWAGLQAGVTLGAVSAAAAYVAVACSVFLRSLPASMR